MPGGMHPGSRHEAWSRPGPLPFLLNEGPTYPNVMIRNGMMTVPSAGKGAGAIARVVCRPAGSVAWRTFMVVCAPRRAAAGLAGSRVRWCSRGRVHPGGAAKLLLATPAPAWATTYPRIWVLPKSSIRSIGHDLARFTGPGQGHVPARLDRNTWLILRRVGGACGQARSRCGGCHGS